MKEDPPSEELSAQTQNRNFKPNWICRPVVFVLVILPALPTLPRLSKTILAGVEKLGWLVKLKNSARNCKLRDSPNRVILFKEKSNVAKPGPIRVFLPRLPKNPAGGSVKTLSSKYLSGPPRMGFLSAPDTRSGLCPPPPDRVS